MAEIAAEMAGYKLDDLRGWSARRDDPKAALYRSFMKKGFRAVDLLGPAVVNLEAPAGDKLPDDIRKAGQARGEHMVTITRQWRDLTVVQLAEAAGLSVELVTAIEAREAEANEMHDFAMARVLNVSPHALTDWSITAPERDTRLS
ncbi:helix-turn-helix transcriptional regulator [Rhizorhabdus sp.]|uniref:helix-turn-helix domain-containing protein n=1 Tax=Rhizorhabdus sp. TaxID=1968843 RepID=UPI0019C5E591|nr:helix-turn-helix transcriptional regulator [Rhizorhabdus sp.]MBD3762336.1 helix-turn-helix transcriptional regulator [Rhizorhabdus sp.]